MTLSEIEAAVQHANPAWQVTVQLVYPADSDPLQSAPIVLTATRRADGCRYSSLSYPRPLHTLTAFVALVTQDLRRATAPGTVPPRWVAIDS